MRLDSYVWNIRGNLPNHVAITESRSRRERNSPDYNEETPRSDDEIFEDCLENLDLVDERDKGKGVQTRGEIKKGTLIGEYEGKILTLDEAIERLNGEPPFFVTASDTINHFIDGEGEEGNILKYINHKCNDPNCEMVFLTSTRVGIQAIKKIQAGEYLNYNYGLVYPEGSVVRRIKCKCTDRCPNYI